MQLFPKGEKHTRWNSLQLALTVILPSNSSCLCNYFSLIVVTQSWNKWRLLKAFLVIMLWECAEGISFNFNLIMESGLPRKSCFNFVSENFLSSLESSQFHLPTQRFFTYSTWPNSQAKWIGVCSKSFKASTSSPFSRKNLTISSRPFLDARCSKEEPLSKSLNGSCSVVGKLDALS